MNQVTKERRIPEVPTDEDSARTLKEVGLNPKHVKQWKRKLINLRCHAPSRSSGCDCYLTFKQYVSLAVEAGLSSPSEIGRTSGKYQMSRFGDAGDYRKGNCRFLTIEENQAEKRANGGYSAQAAKQRRKGATPQILRAAALGRAAQIKQFRVTSPNGRDFLGKDLKAFCLKHGLNQSHMSGVCRGGVSSHKGWTGAYV